MTPFAKAAMSGDVYSEVPMTLAGVVLVVVEAIPRAIFAGSETKPPMAQPMVSTRVRFTWWTVFGSRAS